MFIPGDSITVAPAQTLTDREYQRLRNASIAVLRKIGVDTGGSNVQFAVNPEDGRVLVIEMNPRVSRSSALASKATGFPIAKIAAKLAVGYTLDELKNEITGGAHSGLLRAHDRLCGHQDSAFHLREISRFQHAPHHADEIGGRSDGDRPDIPGVDSKSAAQSGARLEGFDEQLSLPLTEEASEKLSYELRWPGPNRILYVADAFRAGWTLQQMFDATKIDPWFWRRSGPLARREVVQARRFRQSGAALACGP